MSRETIEVERRESVGTIWLNRPEKRNALSPLLVRELHEAIDELGADDAVRSVVIAGRGPAFCAGADLAYLQEMSRYSVLENSADSAALASMLRALHELPKPTIARVHGPAIAGGCGLATVCDIVVAVREASFGYTEVRIGFVPAIVMAFLLRKSAQMRTRELLLTGRIIRAEEALDAGLVTRIVGSAEELDEAIAAITASVTAASPTAIALTKQMLDALDGMPLDGALDYAARMNALARMTPDCQAGVARFLEKQ